MRLLAEKRINQPNAGQRVGAESIAHRRALTSFLNPGSAPQPRTLQSQDGPEVHRPRRHARLVSCWAWVNCERCGHSVPGALAPVIVRWGQDASSDRLRQSAWCDRCRGRGATITLPGWAGLNVGMAPFPAQDYTSARVWTRHALRCNLPRRRDAGVTQTNSCVTSYPDNPLKSLERAKGIEPSTLSLGS
jgi:hypothetical protein